MSRTGRLIGLVLTVLAGGFLVVSWSSPAIRQPIAFNHQKHAENGLDCAACHQHYEASATAGRPETETCLLCHETPLTESAEEESVRAYAQRGEEIPWRRLYKLPPDVYFSHQIHVTTAEVDCQTCHGSIGQSTFPPGRAEVDMTMETCIACHESRGASVDCLACHR